MVGLLTLSGARSIPRFNSTSTGSASILRFMRRPVRALMLVATVALVAAAAWWLIGRGASAPSRADRPNVLLVTIDTLRADRVGVGLTPALDALFGQGVAFSHARAAAPLTLPSHATLMTGALPPAHGVHEN